MVKPLSTMRETQVQAQGWEDSLEKEMAIHPVLLPGKSHGQRSLAGYTVHGVTQSMTERLSTAQHSVPRTHAPQKEKPLNEKPTRHS